MIGQRDSAGWQCVGFNPQSQVSTWIKPDGDEDMLIEERQEIGAILDHNTAARNVAEAGWKGDGLHRVAAIPMAMAHERDSFLHGALQAQDAKALAGVLNDSDFAKLRTKEGAI